MHLQLHEQRSRNEELAAAADDHRARHLRAIRALRAAEADEALARREWLALLRALRSR
ncbi:MAG TPA: hypothetical protein VFD04_25625 [Actinomycetes bacterium]|jgi:hypothetical protein|nr:hypothetical protein [Actinomycetes bacterium]